MISFNFSAIFTLGFNTKNPVIEFSISGTAPDPFFVHTIIPNNIKS